MQGRKKCQFDHQKDIEKKKLLCDIDIEDTFGFRYVSPKQESHAKMKEHRKIRMDHKLGLKQNRQMIKIKRQQRKAQQRQADRIYRLERLEKLQKSQRNLENNLPSMNDISESKQNQVEIEVVADSLGQFDHDVVPAIGDWEVLDVVTEDSLEASRHQDMEVSPSLPQPLGVSEPEHVYHRVMKWFW